MAVRPFYIDADIDGRKTNLKGGTARSDGDHTILLHQRSNGDITTPFKIRQYSIYPIDEVTGKEKHQLETDIIYQGEVIQRHITDY